MGRLRGSTATPRGGGSRAALQPCWGATTGLCGPSSARESSSGCGQVSGRGRGGWRAAVTPGRRPRHAAAQALPPCLEQHCRLHHHHRRAALRRDLLLGERLRRQVVRARQEEASAAKGAARYVRGVGAQCVRARLARTYTHCTRWLCACARKVRAKAVRPSPVHAPRVVYALCGSGGAVRGRPCEHARAPPSPARRSRRASASPACRRRPWRLRGKASQV